jgi:hypothetical protein
MAAYKVYQNSSVDWREIINEIYQCSLSHAIHTGRWGVLYIDISDLDLLKYLPMYEDIYDMYVLPRIIEDQYISSGIHVSKIMEGKTNFKPNIFGEIDILLINEIVDIKVSKNAVGSFNNILQVLSYYLMLNPIESIQKVSLFNPLRGEIYTYEIPDDYNFRIPNILDYMIKARDRNIMQSFD